MFMKSDHIRVTMYLRNLGMKGRTSNNYSETSDLTQDLSQQIRTGDIIDIEISSSQ